MRLHLDNNPIEVFDRHVTLSCPHCQARSGITAVSIPRFELVKRFTLDRVGVVYKCDACQFPIVLRYTVTAQTAQTIHLSDVYEEVERPAESFEYQYLPTNLADDFEEALTCYSAGCNNAFAAMCRRCIQTAAGLLGAEGTSKVQNQLADLRSLGVVDDVAFEQLRTIMLSGHDGAHPHLPSVDASRAGVLLEIMKDVMYQLFVRPAKIREAADLRKQAIATQ